ncbi:Uncharacterised protein [Mycobacteroides abscessus]|nr:Uncharacterised protein [Mycobacteroides abscessus]
MVVILLAFITANHEAADSLVGQQCLIDREVGEILFDRDPLLRVERLTRLDSIERGRWIVGVIGERVRWQSRRKVVAHTLRVRSSPVHAPAHVGHVPAHIRAIGVSASR